MFLYYLSAYLTSARSVTFHMQKQFVAGEPEKVYEPLRKEILSDEVCRYFVGLRNEVEKEGYPTIHVKQFVERKGRNDGASTWYALSSCTLFSAKSETNLDFLEQSIRLEWELTSMSGPPAHIMYMWTFPDYPNGATDVVVACEAFQKRLWQFVFEFRSKWEERNDPDAWAAKFEKFLRSSSGFE
ncbi:MAG: hypothetical protein ACOY6E_03460 [Pseudomonadota bacterium]